MKECGNELEVGASCHISTPTRECRIGRATKPPSRQSDLTTVMSWPQPLATRGVAQHTYEWSGHGWRDWGSTWA